MSAFFFGSALFDLLGNEKGRLLKIVSPGVQVISVATKPLKNLLLNWL